MLIMQKGKFQNINVFKLLTACARHFNVAAIKGSLTTSYHLCAG